MPITIGQNISSLRAQRRLAENSSALSNTFERLSSGQRINSASDDPAGLSISSKLKTDARIFTQAIRNVSDGVSVLNIAEGALGQLTDIVIRQRELAEQSANGTYSLAQRKALHGEANSLVDEFNRIVESTQFNGQNLLDLSNISTSIQVGTSSSQNDRVGIGIGEQFGRAVGTGTFSSAVSYSSVAFAANIATADMNHDGILDIIESPRTQASAGILLGNGDGSFQARVAYTTSGPSKGNAVGDVNGDGKYDVLTTDLTNGKINVLLGNGDGSLRAAISYNAGLTAPGWVDMADFNNDGYLDLVLGDNVTGATNVPILLGNGNGSFKAAVSYAVGTSSIKAPGIGDLNGDGILDLITSDYGSDTLSVLIGNSNGSFRARRVLATGSEPTGIALGDYNRDGFLDIASINFSGNSLEVRSGNGNGTFKAATVIGTGGGPSDIKAFDINGDGILDLAIGENTTDGVRIFIGNTNGSFKAGVLTVGAGGNAEDLAIGDFNGDGVADIAAANDTSGIYIFTSTAATVTTQGYLNLLTQADSRAAMGVLDDTLKRISSEIGILGSYQSRLAIADSNLQTMRENYLAANSRIADADIAEESGQLVRFQILQQAAAAVLAQANTEPALSLNLLGGR